MTAWPTQNKSTAIKFSLIVWLWVSLAKPAVACTLSCYMYHGNLVSVEFLAKHHYSDSIMRAMASQITTVSIVYPTVCSGADKNIKTLRHWPLWGEFTGDRWIPFTKGQQGGKCFHLMTSSCETKQEYLTSQLHVAVSHANVGHLILSQCDNNQRQSYVPWYYESYSLTGIWPYKYILIIESNWQLSKNKCAVFVQQDKNWIRLIFGRFY